MAVESRFVVIRHGVEVETFMDKKAADEYDKMLDMADSLSEMFEQAPVDITETMREELSIYLAQNREQVLVALQAKKAKAPANKATVAKPVPVKNKPVETVAEAAEPEKPEVKVAKTTKSTKTTTRKTAK